MGSGPDARRVSAAERAYLQPEGKPVLLPLHRRPPLVRLDLVAAPPQDGQLLGLLIKLGVKTHSLSHTPCGDTARGQAGPGVAAARDRVPQDKTTKHPKRLNTLMRDFQN